MNDTAPKYALRTKMQRILSKPRSLQKAPTSYICTAPTEMHTRSCTFSVEQLQQMRRSVSVIETPQPTDAPRARAVTMLSNNLAKSALTYIRKDRNDVSIPYRQQTLPTYLPKQESIRQPSVEFKLNDDLIGQIEAVQQYVSHEYNVAINNQGRTQIMKDLPVHTKQAYLDDYETWYPHSRINSQKMTSHLKHIYGTGKQRWLYPGEEAAIIQSMILHLELCAKNPNLLVASYQRVISTLLTQLRLEYLKELPICMRQIEAHWKLLATLFRYQHSEIFNNQNYNRIVKMIESKHHFLDLSNNTNSLVCYLLVKQ